MKRFATTAAMLGLAACLPSLALGADEADEWKWEVTGYLWIASIEGQAQLRANGSPVDFGIDFGQIIDSLKFAGMAYATVHKGKWGFGADVIYLDMGDSVSRTRDVTIDGAQLPAAVTANLDLDVRSWIVTFGPMYRIEDSEQSTFDLTAGVRLLDLDQDLKWSINGSIAGQPLPGQSGSAGASASFWNWVIGAGGQRRFGEDNRWYVQYYADVGSGQTEYTWQAVLGLGYRWDWGAVTGAYRYLDFEMKDSDQINRMTVDGPAIGVTFRF